MLTLLMDSPLSKEENVAALGSSALLADGHVIVQSVAGFEHTTAVFTAHGDTKVNFYVLL